MNNKTLLNSLKKLWKFVSKNQRRKLLYLMVLMIMSSFAEIISMGAVIPFLTVLLDPDLVFKHSYTSEIITFLEIQNAEDLVFPLVVSFIVVVVTAGGLRFAFLVFSTRVAFSIGRAISLNVYRRVLNQSYLDSTNENSGNMINSIFSKSNSLIYSTLYPVLTIVSSSLILIFVIIFLVQVSSLGVFFGVGIFVFFYAIIILLSSAKLKRNSHRIAKESTVVINTIQESLRNMRDVIIDSLQEVYSNIYARSDKILRNDQASNSIIGQSPRYIIETLGIVLIALFAYKMSLEEGEYSLSEVAPLIGVFILAAQRLMPVLQQLFASWAKLQGGRASLCDVLDILERTSLPIQAPSEIPMKFCESLELKEVSFSYDSLDRVTSVLTGVTFNIRKGDCVGVVGGTGYGKSTLIDIVLGLLTPTDGKMIVDSIEIVGNNVRRWQKSIAHVPQEVIMTDASIVENITLSSGKNNIDMDRVMWAAKNAEIHSHISILPDNYNTKTGENGIKLSGGQKQRIGIARALYKEADIIILDEATSALDSKIEKRIMQNLKLLKSKPTMIIIAHRLTTLRDCNRILEVRKDGSVCETTYDKINN